MTLREAIDEFLLAMRADGRSPETVKWYDSVLSAFAHKLPGAALSSFDGRAMRSYIVLLRERVAYLDAPQKPAQGNKLSDASIDSHVTALHSFWGWCAREYGIANPMQNIRRALPRSPVVKAIAPADFVRLFEATDAGIGGVRDRALLAFLADTGCRLGGLVGLKIEDLNLSERSAVVREKRSRTRKVVYTQFTARLLANWLAVRVSTAPEVFTKLRYPRGGLAREGVQQVLLRLKRRAGVSGRVNPHAFRHRFAIAYVQNGGDLMSLAKLMGDDIKTVVDYYGIFSQDELAQLHEKYSPLKGMFNDV